jgi:hypothetical protein
MLAGEGGWDGPNSDEGTDTVVLYVHMYVLCGLGYESIGLIIFSAVGLSIIRPLTGKTI